MFDFLKKLFNSRPNEITVVRSSHHLQENKKCLINNLKANPNFNFIKTSPYLDVLQAEQQKLKFGTRNYSTEISKSHLIKKTQVLKMPKEHQLSYQEIVQANTSYHRLIYVSGQQANIWVQSVTSQVHVNFGHNLYLYRNIDFRSNSLCIVIANETHSHFVKKKNSDGFCISAGYDEQGKPRYLYFNQFSQMIIAPMDIMKKKKNAVELESLDHLALKQSLLYYCRMKQSLLPRQTEPSDDYYY